MYCRSGDVQRLLSLVAADELRPPRRYLPHVLSSSRSHHRYAPQSAFRPYEATDETKEFVAESARGPQEGRRWSEAARIYGAPEGSWMDIIHFFLKYI